MKKEYSINFSDGISIIRSFKELTFQDIIEIIDDMSENYSYERRLWDISEYGMCLTSDELEKIAVYGKLNFIKPSKMAIVVSNNLDFGLARMFEAYRAEKKVKTMVFHKKQEACSWLRETI